jgi:four helix bundle protein
MVKSYRDLKVWQKAIGLAEGVYIVCRDLPEVEKFGLRSQMQRCSVSIASNIAEGYGRNSTKEFAQFLSIARGSVMELETQLTIAVRVELLQRDQTSPLWREAEEVAHA